MTEALLLTLLGMAVVFIVLLLISFMLQGFALFSDKKPAAAPVSAPYTEAVVEDNSEETVAAIMAAITAYMGGADFKVKSITPLVVRPLISYQCDSSWSAAGIAENNRS